MNKYNLHEGGFYGRLEGTVRFTYFCCDVPFILNSGSGEVYAERCCEFVEKLTCEHTVFKRLLEVIACYLTDYIDELREDADDFDFALPEAVTAEDVSAFCRPVHLSFQQHELLYEEDSPVAFVMKMSLNILPDEEFMVAMNENDIIYVGECRNISVWNENLLTKKYNYITNL